MWESMMIIIKHVLYNKFVNYGRVGVHYTLAISLSVMKKKERKKERESQMKVGSFPLLYFAAKLLLSSTQGSKPNSLRPSSVGSNPSGSRR